MEPVRAQERINSVDVLRGVALLGILLMNVVSLSLPDPAYWDPSGHGGDSGWNLRIFFINNLLIEGTMRGIFSMLFGAGVILFTAVKEEKGGGLEIANAWYRRTIWLILFGIIHAYFLIFPGEVLFYYGIVGLFLFPVRKVPPARLVLFSAFLIMVLVLIKIADYHDVKRIYEETIVAEEMLAGGEEITADQYESMNTWYYKLASYKPDAASRERVISSMRSGYFPAFKTMAPYVRFMQTEYFYRNGFLDALSMMLLGMALFRWRIFHGEKKYRFYGLMVLLGYGIGIPVNWYETTTYIQSQFDLITYFRLNQTYDLGRLTLTMGHVGLIMICIKLNFLKVLKRAIAAVGRMALTNYVMHSFIATIVFIAFRQYGQWQRYELYYLVAGIWLFQLIFSPLWLKYFRFGPLEWIWRRLTYGRAFLLSH
ncbi:MAG: DUF418 domain-containing protein [Bacteroidales bacterium]|nr:DUF418 domain-containing protein [Bacteroidales bacterium]